MKKLSETHKKLVLSRETLRLLEEREAAYVAGGATVLPCTNTCGCTDTCRAACTTIRTTCC